MMLPDRIFDEFFDVKEPRMPKDRMECDIYEKDGKYFLEASVFGFKKDEIKIECEDGNIIIIAERNEDESNSEDKKYLRRERHFHSKIERAFYLGEIDEENIKASFENGLLVLEIPKKEIKNTRKSINID